MGMCTDANNLVTTTKSTHLPEQKETVHIINMLRHEVQPHNFDILAHVVSDGCLADCLTKYSEKADDLVKAVFTGALPNMDAHPPLRGRLKPSQRAYLCSWVCNNLIDP